MLCGSALVLKPDDRFANQCGNVADLGALGIHAKVETTDTSKAKDALELLCVVLMAFCYDDADMPDPGLANGRDGVSPS